MREEDFALQPDDDRFEQQRLETGPVQLGDDWPGVFIRGDDAIMYLSGLRRPDHPMHGRIVEGLISLLSSCIVRPAQQNMSAEYETQYLKPYADCALKP